MIKFLTITGTVIVGCVFAVLYLFLTTAAGTYCGQYVGNYFEAALVFKPIISIIFLFIFYLLPPILIAAYLD